MAKNTQLIDESIVTREKSLSKRQKAAWLTQKLLRNNLLTRDKNNKLWQDIFMENKLKDNS